MRPASNGQGGEYPGNKGTEKSFLPNEEETTEICYLAASHFPSSPFPFLLERKLGKRAREENERVKATRFTIFFHSRYIPVCTSANKDSDLPSS